MILVDANFVDPRRFLARNIICSLTRKIEQI